MAQAWSDPGKQAWKYQYSVLPALHGRDVSGFFGPASPYQGPDFVRAFQSTLLNLTSFIEANDRADIVGNFVTANNPSISLELANGASANSNTTSNPSTDWPQFDVYNPVQINLNQTGGTPTEIDPGLGEQNITVFTGPGLTNDFTLVNAYEWEAGRGYRCDFWRSVGAIVPE